MPASSDISPDLLKVESNVDVECFSSVYLRRACFKKATVQLSAECFLMSILVLILTHISSCKHS